MHSPAYVDEKRETVAPAVGKEGFGEKLANTQAPTCYQEDGQNHESN
jgi:hypothetical protein